MKHIRISYFIPIFLLSVCFSAFSMDRDRGFTFDRKNYSRYKRQEIKNKRFFGVLKSNYKKIDVVNLSKETLHFSIECDYKIDELKSCDLGRYLVINFDGNNQDDNWVYDIDKKERLLTFKGICQRTFFVSGKLICLCDTKKREHRRCGQDILIYDLATKKLIAEYENCVLTNSIATLGMLLDYSCRYMVFFQRKTGNIEPALVLFDLEKNGECLREKYESICVFNKYVKRMGGRCIFFDSKIWKNGDKPLFLSKMKHNGDLDRFIICDLEKPFQEKLHESKDKKGRYQDAIIFCKDSDKKEKDLDQD
ncbi:hypothetical protein ACFLYA_00425 [Candidatus Dependentiae bacterium]